MRKLEKKSGHLIKKPKICPSWKDKIRSHMIYQVAFLIYKYPMI